MFDEIRHGLREEIMITTDPTHAGRSTVSCRIVCAIAAATLVWLAAPAPVVAATGAQETFATPEQAVEALVGAARGGRADDLVKILGPGSKKLVLSGDPVADRTGREKFVSAYEAAHKIDRGADGNASLTIGDDGWPFPIPIVKRGDAWAFDTKTGEKEILARRLGRNELSVIEVCRAYVDAQRDYATKDRNGNGVLEYAQSLVSRPGKEDGLYWTAEAGAEESPLGPLMAQARAEGYGGKNVPGKHHPYHGYLYKILKSQGKNARGGAYSYMAGGRMIGGFAMVAYPSSYRLSGIKTFIVNQDGVVYEKNLGPNTAAIARAMTKFDPDPSWKTP